MDRLSLGKTPNGPADPLDTALFRRKMGGRLYEKAIEALENLDEALQLDHHATTEAAWYDLAARIMYKLRQYDTATQCESLRDEAVTRQLLLGPMRERRK